MGFRNDSFICPLLRGQSEPFLFVKNTFNTQYISSLMLFVLDLFYFLTLIGLQKRKESAIFESLGKRFLGLPPYHSFIVSL
ncbi:MAG: hypothetical protein ACJAUB_002914 [Cryomorphaceae bacterium]|jgi:hypothetical protein